MRDWCPGVPLLLGRVCFEWGRMQEHQGRGDEARAKLALAEELYRKAMTPTKP